VTSINLPRKRKAVIPKRTKMMIIDITDCFPPYGNATGKYYRQLDRDVKQNET
jgi:hypothetical protein